jgi:hypothetical protein
MAVMSPFVFGWAKPVPVDFSRLHKPKRDMIWVAAAGPGSNLLMAILWLLFAKAMVLLGMREQFFLMVAAAGIQVNLMLMALNLLPIPPLDGGRILVGVLPRHDAGLIIAALAQGAAGVIALTDPPEAWRECVLVVMGGGRWLGGPGLEISLEDKRAVYDVARHDDLQGDVTVRTKLYVRQRVADRFRS